MKPSGRIKIPSNFYGIEVPEGIDIIDDYIDIIEDDFIGNIVYRGTRRLFRVSHRSVSIQCDSIDRAKEAIEYFAEIVVSAKKVEE